MAAINWTREAEQWLHDIYEYIAIDNPTAAARTVDGIYERAQLLTDFPQLGYRYHQIEDRHVRILFYRIAYLIDEGGDIDILGVFHGALDINRHLF